MPDHRKYGRYVRQIDRRYLWIFPAVLLTTTLVYVKFFQHIPRQAPVSDSDIGIITDSTDYASPLVPMMTDEQFEQIKQSYAAQGITVSRSGTNVRIMIPEKIIDHSKPAQKSMDDLAEDTRLKLGADAVVSIIDDKGKALAKSAPRL